MKNTCNSRTYQKHLAKIGTLTYRAKLTMNNTMESIGFYGF